MSPSHDRRTLWLGAIGAFAGLGMAGYALFTAEGTSILYVAPENVAVVNQQPISRIDYVAALQTMYAKTLDQTTPEERRKILDDMIFEELMVQRAKELDVALTDPMVRSAMASAVQAQAAMSAYTEQPNEAKLKAYYETHRAEYQSEGVIALQAFIFPDEAAAHAASAALKAGQPRAAVLKAHGGADSGLVSGEEFYFAAKIHLGETLFDAAQSLPAGGVAQVGQYVLVVAKNIRPVPYTFESARAEVLQDYRRESANRLQAANRDFLRRRANILLAEDVK